MSSPSFGQPPDVIGGNSFYNTLAKNSAKEEAAQKKEAAEQLANSNRVHVTPDGKFLVDGKQVGIMEVLFQVFQEASLHAKERLAISIQELKDANLKAKMATEWLNAVRGIRPTGDGDTSVKQGAMKDEVAKFKEKYPGHDPFKEFSISNMDKNSYKQSDIDQVIEGTKSYLSTVNSDQQMIQLNTERYTHMVDEANEAMSSIEKSISQTIETMISKI